MDRDSQTNSSGSCNELDDINLPAPLNANADSLRQNLDQARKAFSDFNAQDLEGNSWVAQLEIILRFLGVTENVIVTVRSLFEEALVFFLGLGTPRFLIALFHSRQAIKARPSRSTDSSNVSEAILFRLLSIFSLMMRTSADLLEGTGLPTSLHVQNRNALHSAVKQLPETWELLPTVLSNPVYSPIAQRCALHLLFLAWVLPGDLNREACPIAEDARTLLKHLYKCVENSQQGVTLLMQGATEGQRNATVSMFLCLFSKVHRLSHDLPSPLAPFRPRCFGFLLELVMLVMGEANQGLCIPLPELTQAQRCLMRCGNFVPWSWSVWTDNRAANSEQLVFLTSNWLFHLDKDIGERTNPLMHRSNLRDATLLDVTAAKAMLSQLLHSIAQEVEENLTTEFEATLKVLVRACVSLILVLQLPPTNDFYPEKTVMHCLESALNIFVHLGHTDDELHAKETMLELFTLVDHQSLAACVQVLTSGQRCASFMDKLDRAVSSCKSSFPHKPENITAGIQPNSFRITHVTLDFLTIICQANNDHISLIPVLPFLGKILRSLEGIPSKASPHYPRLLNSVFVAVSTVRDKHAFQEHVRCQDIRELSISVLSNEHGLATASAYAYYIICRNTPIKTRYILGLTWKYFQNSLGSILAGNFSDSDEEASIALLSSSSICLALLSLLHHNQGLVAFVLCSPWTISLCSALKTLLEGDSPTQTPQFTLMLKSRLDIFGSRLLTAISSQLSNGRSSQDMISFKSRLLFFKDKLGRCHLLAKVDPVQ